MSQVLRLEEAIAASAIVGTITFYMYSNPYFQVGLVMGGGMAIATYGLMRAERVQALRRAVLFTFSVIMWTAFLLYLGHIGFENIARWIAIHERIPFIPGAGAGLAPGLSIIACPYVTPEVLWTGGFSPTQTEPGVFVLFPPTLQTFLIIFALYLAVGFLLGRTFCGWMCPFGAVGEACAMGRKKRWTFARLMEKIPLPNGKTIPGALRVEVRDVQYGIALGTLIASLYFFVQWFCIFCWAGVASWLGAYLNAAFYVGIFLVFFVILPFMTKKRWCQVICPVGTGLGLMGKVSPFRINLEKEYCDSCYICMDVCPTSAITLNSLKKGGSPTAECIRCNKCVEACHMEGVTFQIRKSDILAKPWFIPVTITITTLWFVWFVDIILQLGPRLMGF